MKDKDSYFRGACNSCDCQEYANDGGIKCADCKCPASRHKLTYWTNSTKASSIKNKKYSMSWISLQWFSLLNPFAWITLGWINIFWIKFPILALKGAKKPDKVENLVIQLQKVQGKVIKQIDQVKSNVVEQLPIVAVSLIENYPKLWNDFVHAIPNITKAPNIDSKLQVVHTFHKRLMFGLASLVALVLLGVFGFRGRHLNFEILNSVYLLTLCLLTIGAGISYTSFLTSKSIFKRTMAIIFFGVNSFSVLVYSLLYLGITPKLYGPLGIPIQTARFIDWNVSLPCLLEISSLIRTGKSLERQTRLKIQAFILSLLISSGQLTPFCEILGGFGVFLIGSILIDLNQPMSNQTIDHDKNTRISLIQKSIFWMFSILVFTWTFGLLTVFRFPESEIFYSLTDASFKVGFTILALYL